MHSNEMFPLGERTRDATDVLAERMRQQTYLGLPQVVRDRLESIMIDLMGVTVAGMRTPELVALVEAWGCPAGEVPLPATQVHTSPETAAYLSSVAACCLELDEGNKFAAGHPAAHVVFAAMAATRISDKGVSGEEFLTAVAAGYEVAARFGYALDRDGQWHTHGHWGATGAACASALLLGANAPQVAAAIDAATGLMNVSPWATVLSGDFTRNLWIGQANLAGLHAARLAMAGLVHNRGGSQQSLGTIVGRLDPARLVEDLDSRWLMTAGYAKRHAACSYIHAAVDLVQSLRTQDVWRRHADLGDIARVQVVTHSLARPLLGRDPESRLAAMFSLPFVTSCAVVNGTVDPETMEPGTSAFEAAQAFIDRVEVEIRDSFDAHLPDKRLTELRIEFTDGEFLVLAQPNPIGDADHFPFSMADIEDKLRSLIGGDDTARICDVVQTLPHTDDVASELNTLP